MTLNFQSVNGVVIPFLDCVTRKLVEPGLFYTPLIANLRPRKRKPAITFNVTKVSSLTKVNGKYLSEIEHN